MSKSLIIGLMRELAQEMDVKIRIEPDWEYVAQIITADGRKRYFRNTVLDLNGAGSTEIAKDKDFASFFLKNMHYPVPEGQAFYTDRWAQAIGSDQTSEKALSYAQTLGFPVIVKPNSKSQGAGVALVNNAFEFQEAFEEAAYHERVILVQRPVVGKDYRIVVLDGEVISAYERRPLMVTGDGQSSVRQLLVQKQEAFIKEGRDTVLDLEDPRIGRLLKGRQATLDSIPPKGEVWPLLPNANLSTGGDAIDVTPSLHADWKALSARIAHDMNLRYIGIDIMTPHGLDVPPADYCIIEINAAPGLDNYATIGEAQQRIVKELYRKVLLALLV